MNASISDILDHLAKEDFERAAEAAHEYLRDQGGASDADRPYAEYFKLFAEGYRTWQITYQYTEIRNYFRLANQRLSEELGKVQRDNPASASDHERLLKAFDAFTRMLEAYTRCENSFINNDPFSLVRHAEEAQRAEREGIACLEDRRSADPTLERIGDWLENYFATNLQLHIGLEACAQIYARIFSHEQCDPAFFKDKIGEAKRALVELQGSSTELASELNAHVRMIGQHYERVHMIRDEGSLTFLCVRKGRLVLSLSAGCDAQTARDIIREPASTSRAKSFEIQLMEEFRRCGLEATKFRLAPLHDIFQTTFGAYFLRTLTFDLGSIDVVFLGGRRFTFDVHVGLTGLGTCTVYFSYAIGEPGLTVEEIRSLQSLICPHAGQVEIVRPPAPASPISADRFRERLELALLADDLIELERWLAAQPPAFGRHLGRHIHELRSQVHNIVDGLLNVAKVTADHRQDEADGGNETLRRQLDEFLEKLRETGDEPSTVPAVRADLDKYLNTLTDHCDQVTYVSHFAERVLGAVERVFRQRNGASTARGGEDEFEHASHWLRSSDTGWYTYVSASSLEEVADSGSVLLDPSFSAIESHPDVRGFILEPREARASFDDWRFTRLPASPGSVTTPAAHDLETASYPNLASIRSHESDAFFGSEYRAFLYFPDDPKFLTDQYEATVGLMMWLGTSLKFYEQLSQKLSQEFSVHIRDRLEITDARRHDGGSRTDYRRDLDRISLLRGKASEAQTLVSKAGISRYKDHGDLMIRLVEGMKFDRIVELLDRRLAQLDDVYRQIVERIERETVRQAEEQSRFVETRTRNIELILIFITAVIGMGQLGGAVDGLVYWKDAPTRQLYTSRLMWVFLIIVFVVGVAAGVRRLRVRYLETAGAAERPTSGGHRR